MATESLVLGALFFVAVGAGWALGRLSRRRSAPGPTTVPPAEYYRSLDHILRDDSDKALSALQGMAEADPGVVEIHFALATLFRRRGETDRAIRIHQDLLARPKLARRHREQALFDLAEDYLKAGLFDRAESVYLQLVEKDAFRSQSLQRLVGIYERQKDWDKAIAMREQLRSLVSENQDHMIAHYHCEQAAQARAAGDLATMRSELRKARGRDRNILRGAVMRADLATLRDDMATALRLYQRVLEEDPGLATLVLRRLHGCLDPASKEMKELLSAAVRRNPQVAPALGRVGLATGQLSNEIVASAARDLVEANPALARMATAIDDPHELSEILRNLGLARLEYLCRECGYRALDLHWQCPACLNWDCSRPDISFAAHKPAA